MKLFGLSLFAGFLSVFSIPTFAAFEISTCWKGSTQSEQNSNRANCKTQRQDPEKCSDNAWEHGQGLYDVCLMKVTGELIVVSLFQGQNQQQQNANFNLCKAQESIGQVCVTNAWVHLQGLYDVALMASKPEKM